MGASEQLSRRRLLQVSGATSVALLAGCADENGDEPDEEPDGDEPDDEEPDTGEWEDIDEFVFEGQIEAWTGVEPALIEDEDNPTITLIEGEEYDFTWINADGVTHNFEIRDGNDGVINDYQSNDLDEEGEETTLEGVVASDEMAVYICAYHPDTQVGDITVETE